MKPEYEVTGFLKGPFVNESHFQRVFLAEMRKLCKDYRAYAIENEDRSPGMPDLLFLHGTKPAVLIEMKYIRKDGRMKFTKFQPLWYKRNMDLKIHVVAWDSREDRIFVFSPADIVKRKALSMKIGTNAKQLAVSQWVKGVFC